VEKLTDKTTVEQWEKIGFSLLDNRNKVENQFQWNIGDWWAFGENKYGDRKATVESEEWQDNGGPSFQTCSHWAAVAKRFDTTLRRRRVSFSHHLEVVALPVEKAEEFLDEAASEKWSVRQLRKEVKDFNNTIEGNTKSREEYQETIALIERYLIRLDTDLTGMMHNYRNAKRKIDALGGLEDSKFSYTIQKKLESIAMKLKELEAFFAMQDTREMMRVTPKEETEDNVIALIPHATVM